MDEKEIMSYYGYKIAVIMDKAIKRTVWNNHIIEYRITIYRNILRGFEVYCN